MINIAYNSNIKQSGLKDFFRAQSVNFTCQKFVKKRYIKMINIAYNVK